MSDHGSDADPAEGTKTRFGSFPAAIVLQERVDRCDDKTVSRDVSRLLQDFNEGLGHIAEIQDRRIRYRIALLWRNDFLERASIHPSVNDYLKNVLSTYYRDVVDDQ